MPRKSKLLQNATDEAFGLRMARLRKTAGYSQRELAKELGISQRMVAYYESQSEHPPAHLIPRLVALFGLSTEELLGIKPIKLAKPAANQRLLQRMLRIEKLPIKEKKQLLALIDAFLERDAFAKKAG
jgi:transcriptional regulator with XRE-family HTH domain